MRATTALLVCACAHPVGLRSAAGYRVTAVEIRDHITPALYEFPLGDARLARVVAMLDRSQLTFRARHNVGGFHETRIEIIVHAGIRRGSVKLDDTVLRWWGCPFLVEAASAGVIREAPIECIDNEIPDPCVEP